ncbi:hypothetical protein [Flavobacterium sp. 3HN19-14]|uniref:hypothetical protein n=1 Tax=Flavobacterium sp. 3HN19-14 TaxID=3448133 RepID=UPI003EDF6342
MVTKADATTATATDASITAAKAKVAAILTPFDLAISGGLGSAEGQKVRTAVLELKNLGANLIAGASKLGLTVNNG